MPRNQYVAQFLGEPTINLLECATEQRSGEPVLCTLPNGPLHLRGGIGFEGTTLLAIRPHHVRVDHRAGPDSGVAKVADIENLGSEHVLHLDYAGQHLAAMATAGICLDRGDRLRHFRSQPGPSDRSSQWSRGGFSTKEGGCVTALSLAGVSKKFGAVQALSGVDLSVSKGEFLCLVGPTNAGKSTLLKTIAGLHPPDEGRVIINGQDVTELEPGQRKVSLLFQTVALFPNRSGFDNIAFPLRQAGTSGRSSQRTRSRSRGTPSNQSCA